MTREDEIRVRLEAATPGPWVLRNDVIGTVARKSDKRYKKGYREEFTPLPRNAPGGGFGLASIKSPGQTVDFDPNPNGNQMAHAPDDIRYLLDRVAKLEEVHSIIRIFENKVYPLIPTC